jgi:hypothetical protein
MIALRYASLEYTSTGAVTRFADGSSYGALPHDEPHYHAVAHRLGYCGDIMLYCREHELAHHLIAEEFGSHSPVIWALAHGEVPPRMIAAAEEALVMALQRYARANEVPLIEGIDWDALKRRFLGLLDPHDEGDIL